MTLAMALLLRVVRRRMDRGEALDDVLSEYPKLTEAEWAEIKGTLG
ncbi:hypothetical protein [Oscillibacter sp.]|nr:hypothetical protein [Oscillibacter sp.]MBP3509418.1 hypothetical protein [Oscillibacter sp.]